MELASQYIPLFVMFVFGVGLALVINVLTHIIGRRKDNPVKLDVYECGIPLLTTGRIRFSIQFYLVAILFLIFDLETVVIIPWAVVFKDLIAFTGGWQIPLYSFLVFILILIVGFIYEIKKGAMKWD
jgi:NADH-quinone oxidoreductase subunit A